MIFSIKRNSVWCQILSEKCNYNPDLVYSIWILKIVITIQTHWLIQKSCVPIKIDGSRVLNTLGKIDLYFMPSWMEYDCCASFLSISTQWNSIWFNIDHHDFVKKCHHDHFPLILEGSRNIFIRMKIIEWLCFKRVKFLSW